MLNFLKQFYKSIIATLAILYLTLASPSEFKELPVIAIPHVDKLVHSLMFFVLAFVLFFDFRSLSPRSDRFSSKFLIICVLFPILFGGVIELMQEAWFFPRSAEWLDWLSDIVGVFFALIIASLFKNKFRRL